MHAVGVGVEVSFGRSFDAVAARRLCKFHLQEFNKKKSREKIIKRLCKLHGVAGVKGELLQGAGNLQGFSLDFFCCRCSCRFFSRFVLLQVHLQQNKSREKPAAAPATKKIERKTLQVSCTLQEFTFNTCNSVQLAKTFDDFFSRFFFIEFLQVKLAKTTSSNSIKASAEADFYTYTHGMHIMFRGSR